MILETFLLMETKTPIRGKVSVVIGISVIMPPFGDRTIIGAVSVLAV